MTDKDQRMVEALSHIWARSRKESQKWDNSDRDLDRAEIVKVFSHLESVAAEALEL